MDCYIFDIEGTLSDCRHRDHLYPVEARRQSDWDEYQDGFPSDPVNNGAAAMLRALAADAFIVISTGLPEKRRAQVETWLDNNDILIDVGAVLMRQHSHGVETSVGVKLSHLRWIRAQGWTPLAIFDDREDICEAFAKEGVNAFRISMGEA